MKVVSGYDRSQCGDSALNDLTHAGRPGKVTNGPGFSSLTKEVSC